MGKTHLLNAIGNYALVKDPTLKVRYVTSEEFTNEFIEALGDTNQNSGQIKEFNRRYREVDVLLIDDIQFLSGKDATLEQFFHTFNTLHQANKRIVIASDVPPKDLQGFNERLISRFESGLTVDVKPPDLETRIAILRMIAHGTNVQDDVLNLIAERFTENIRELEGALNRDDRHGIAERPAGDPRVGGTDVAGLFLDRCGDQAHRHHHPGGQVLLHYVR